MGNKVREIRQSQGRTMTDLAISSGTHVSHLSLIERQSRVGQKVAQRLAQALKKDVKEVFPDLEVKGNMTL